LRFAPGTFYNLGMPNHDVPGGPREKDDPALEELRRRLEHQKRELQHLLERNRGMTEKDFEHARARLRHEMAGSERQIAEWLAKVKRQG
jgi:guanylate kinase